MTDRFRSRLSEYLDGTLAPNERTLVERHLADCPTCARILADLERVVERAGRVAPRAPTTDLWPGIAARLPVPAPQGIVEASGRTVTRRRIAFSIPQLAAAVVTLVSLSGALAWLAGSHGSQIAGNPVATTTGTGQATRNPAVQAAADSGEPLELETTAYYAASIEELERILFDPSREVPPQTEARVRRALVTIDRAIEDARQALEQMPGDPYLNEHVRSTLRRKSEFLRGALRLSAQS